MRVPLLCSGNIRYVSVTELWIEVSVGSIAKPEAELKYSLRGGAGAPGFSCVVIWPKFDAETLVAGSPYWRG